MMKFWTKKGLINMTLEIPEIMTQNSVYLRNHQELGIEKDIALEYIGTLHNYLRLTLY